MLHLLLIAACISLLIAPDTPSQVAGTHFASPLAATIYLIALLVIPLLAHIRTIGLAKKIDHTGHAKLITRAEQRLHRARLACIVVFLIGVQALGTLEFVRKHTGDLIGIDEVLVLIPLILVLAWTWWAQHPIERRIREATLLRQIESGKTIYPIPTRLEYVADAMRNHIGIVLIPVFVLLTAAEAAGRVPAFLAERFPAINQPWSSEAAQLIAILLLLLFMPTIMIRLWRTTQLSKGPLRDSLIQIAQSHRIRIRSILIWHTHGSILNGAVVGFTGVARYILLTDALLDRLRRDELAAVMAHEIGHARLHHMPFLAASIIGPLLVASEGTAMALTKAVQQWPSLATTAEQWAEPAAISAGLIATTLLFGHTSRVFERQADAFAIKHLSKHPQHASIDIPPSETITPQAATAMASSLKTVTNHNHLEQSKFTWRHGSVTTRLAAITACINMPLNKLPIDRVALRLKVTSEIILLVGCTMAIMSASTG